MKKRVIINFIFLFIIYSTFAEKWIGQTATYQLIEGAPTTSGEPFKRALLTAACNGFKLGATVEVTNVVTGKTVQVKINDRISTDSKYFVLLTPQAAASIDLEWETGLVVVSASFNDINSTDVLPVNGIVSEGTPDEEKVRNFPVINWPDASDDRNENKVDAVTVVPEEEPVAKPEIADQTDDAAIIETAPAEDLPPVEDATTDQTALIVPQEPQKITPDKADTTSDMAPAPLPVQIAEDTLPPPYAAPQPVKPAEEPAAPVVAEKEEIPEPKPIIYQEEQAVETPATILPQPVITVTPQQATENGETFDKIPWSESLEKNKLYIKYFSSSRQDDFAIKYFNYSKLFGKIVAYRKGNLYHLLVGPIAPDKIDTSLQGIRNFGFRDAYIIKGGAW